MGRRGDQCVGGDRHGRAQRPIVLPAAIDDDVVIAIFQAEQIVTNIAIELNAVDLWQIRVVIAFLNPVRGSALRVAVDQ